MMRSGARRVARRLSVPCVAAARWHGTGMPTSFDNGGQIVLRSQGFPDFVEKWGRGPYYQVGALGAVATAAIASQLGVAAATPVAFSVAVYWWIGIRDIRSTHALRRNFPVLAHMRYILETVRPEVRQYFIEGDFDAVPFDRTQRSTVYQRAKNAVDNRPFGTLHDVYSREYEWAKHSMFPRPKAEGEKARVLIGASDCKQPYSASLLNVSGMSYGALSENAILALNGGAKLGGFYHNTGEGGISRFHLEPGGDLVWNIGSGYFGCRDMKTGKFCPERFAENAARPSVKMIEIKLSQGAKPGKGGILPRSKITPYIAEARGCRTDEDCHSPNMHSAFEGPRGLVEFIARLRELSGGKPVGIKLCVGHPEEFMAVCHAMLELKVHPDFVTVDGAEGGTGAAPPEFSNHVGTPLMDGLVAVDRILRGTGLRDRVKVISSGKVVTGFNIVRNLALGADLCNAARAMMFALGCIQALKCHTNKCPTGITTMDPALQGGLVVPYKALRVRNYQEKTVSVALDIIAAMGLDGPGQVMGHHVMRRINPTNVAAYDDIYPELPDGCLVDGTGPRLLVEAWEGSRVLLDGHISGVNPRPILFGADMSSKMTRELLGAPPPGQSVLVNRTPEA
eukprot:TRINITY_DN15176_c0_g3_i1.p1 TRINITY_DN15176_c0_g3~~TRINITY_DN15176_c0_g3_i1.p1  ORF type:complete len:652 (+),score=206.88 TRINITY_DN15176_c0_g3_i1:88-1956(+)